MVRDGYIKITPLSFNPDAKGRGSDPQFPLGRRSGPGTRTKFGAGQVELGITCPALKLCTTIVENECPRSSVDRALPCEGRGQPFKSARGRTMKFFILLIAVVVAAAFLFDFSGTIREFVAPYLSNLSSGTSTSKNSYPNTASPRRERLNGARTSTPEGFRGPVGPPHIIGPSANPPNY